MEANEITSEVSAKLQITNEECAVLDQTILHWATYGKRRGVFTDKKYNEVVVDQDLLKKADEMIAEGLVAVKSKVANDTAEKLFDRLSEIVDGWKETDQQNTLAVIFFRYADTMRYFIAYHGKYHGKKRAAFLPKKEALAELKARGLTKGKS